MERVDDLGNGYKIIQDTDCFCFGTDSVLLSEFAVIRQHQKAVDLCSGNGIIPILMCAKTNASDISGIEIQKRAFELAEKSVALNELDNRIHLINDDVKNALDYFEIGSVDVITCNPPYMLNDSGLQNISDSKTIARHEVLITFDEIAEVSSKLLKFGGKLFVVNRCERLSDVIFSMRKHGIEPKRLKMVHPYPNSAPNLFLIEGKKGASSSLKLEVPVYLREDVKNG